MGEKYKLKCWYPSLPKNWKRLLEKDEVVVELAEHSFLLLRNPEGCGVRLNYEEVVNNSEFWEEVKERIIYHGGCHDCITPQNKCPRCQYYKPDWRLPNLRTEVVKKEYEILKETYNTLIGKWEIQSVKRLNDGEIFSIGDSAVYESMEEEYSSWKIQDFIFLDAKLLARLRNNNNYIISEYITHVKKSKPLMLVTEDGYKCALNERVFGVLPKGSWETNFYQGEGIPVGFLFIDDKLKSSAWKYFKLKENAEKYIEDNKPIYSKKDILNLFGKLKTHAFISWDDLLKELELTKKGK